MVNTSQGEEELVGSQNEDRFVNMEHRQDRQHTPNVVVESHHTEHTGRSRSRSKSHTSYDLETLRLQREVDRLCRKLRSRKHDRGSPSPPSSEGSKGSRDR